MSTDCNICLKPIFGHKLVLDWEIDLKFSEVFGGRWLWAGGRSAFPWMLGISFPELEQKHSVEYWSPTALWPYLFSYMGWQRHMIFIISSRYAFDNTLPYIMTQHCIPLDRPFNFLWNEVLLYFLAYCSHPIIGRTPSVLGHFSRNINI